MLSGKCECGTVRYRVADAFRYAMNCHCSRCRAGTGSAFKAFAGIERDKLELTDGLDSLLVFGEKDLNHTRCGVCGSFLFSVVRNGAYVHIAMGSLVDAPSIRPTQEDQINAEAERATRSGRREAALTARAAEAAHGQRVMKKYSRLWSSSGCRSKPP